MAKFLPRLLALFGLIAVPSFSAHAQVDGQCGSANGVAPDSVLTASNDKLCDAGTVVSFSGSGPWSWSCQGGNGGATASCAALAATANTCLPFTVPSRDALLNSPRKVFAFYFGDYFVLSRDNLPAATDGYNTVWLQSSDPTWTTFGGFLRTRPLPVSQGPNSLYRMMNFAREVRMAMARGITGFAYEVSEPTCPQDGVGGCLQTLNELLAAAQSVDARFQIMLVPDANMVQSYGPQAFNDIVTAVWNNPGIYKYNGQMVVAPWWGNLGTSVPVSTWTSLEQTLANNNTPIFFMPIDTSDLNRSAQEGAMQGWGYFATAAPQEGAPNDNLETEWANLSPPVPYMAGVTPQHYRPSTYTYWESIESTSLSDSIGLGFINGWQSVITPATPSLPPWVLITTWNDFSESTSIAPYTDSNLSGSVGTAFYNLNGYYASWYLTGSPPAITHDMLYYFHKKEPVGAIPTASGAVGTATNSKPAYPTEVALPTIAPGVDLIEVVAFLTQPGTVSVSIGGNVTNFSAVQGGPQVFQVPLAPGIPTFTLSRNGQTVISFQGQTMIYGISSGLPSGYTDMTYWSGGGSANGVCNLSVPPESLTSTVADSAGLCGPASGSSASSAPTSGLCSTRSSATASSVIGSGPFIWSCSDTNANTSVCATR